MKCQNTILPEKKYPAGFYLIKFYKISRQELLNIEMWQAIYYRPLALNTTTSFCTWSS